MTAVPAPTEARDAAHRLSTYVNGTHAGVRRSHRRVTCAMVVEALDSVLVSEDTGGRLLSLGREPWVPHGDPERKLRDALAGHLSTDGVVDLVLYGSIARHATTGFSDVDAILVVADDAARDRRRLRVLRSRILAAERAVLAYQPMQHHGFLAVTPILLRNASAALGLPAEALATTSSLFGRQTNATCEGVDGVEERFDALARSIRATTSWPEHPWELHRSVAMFELAPVLYMQASGRPCAKHQSFRLAREEFQEEWQPYDVLSEVRRRWPREPRPALALMASAVRNPWAAVAMWRRFSAAVPGEAAGLLGDDCLHGLQDLVASMVERLRIKPAHREQPRV